MSSKHIFLDSPGGKRGIIDYDEWPTQDWAAINGDDKWGLFHAFLHVIAKSDCYR